MIIKGKWSKISLFFLFLVALIGTLLRASSLIEIPLDYTNLVHTHSHVAFQGWVYTIMFLVLTNYFLDKQQFQKGRYHLQFTLTLFVIVGVLVSFSLQGYGLFSIVFSTLFQLLSYWFIYRFFKDTRSVKPTISLRFIKTGLLLCLLSSIMPYAVGILSFKGFAETEIYQSFVYTFMHFQYNGWFLFVVLGLFYKFLESNNVQFNKKHAKTFYWLFVISIIPAISLSLLGMSFSKYLTFPAYFSALLQGIGLVFFLKSLTTNYLEFIKQKNKWLQFFILAFLISFIIKTFLQSISAFPVFWSQAFDNKFILLSYLHLSLIGVVSLLFLGLMFELKWLILSRLNKFGTVLLFLGFVSTEILLILGGLGLYFNTLFLVIGSASMAVGVLFFIVGGDARDK